MHYVYINSMLLIYILIMYYVYAYSASLLNTTAGKHNATIATLLVDIDRFFTLHMGNIFLWHKHI